MTGDQTRQSKERIQQVWKERERKLNTEGKVEMTKGTGKANYRRVDAAGQGSRYRQTRK